MSIRDQHVIDALQIAIPRAQLVLESAQRQHDDAAAVLAALATVVGLFTPPARVLPDAPDVKPREPR